MRHLDGDRLALHALAEPLAPADQQELTAHLAECAQCRRELGSLRETAALAREAGAHRDAGAWGPPERVWDEIVAELGLAAAHPPPARLPRSVRRRARVSRALALAAAAAAGVLGTLVTVRPWAGQSEQVVFTARLAAVSGGPTGARGQATVLQRPAGETLRVVARGLPARRGYYEVWLFDPQTGKMLSVGTLGADSAGSFALPATVDLRAYRVVDVSAEDYDGDQTHSKISVLRGGLSG